MGRVRKSELLNWQFELPLHIICFIIYVHISINGQMDPGQSQMLLNITEWFGLLLAEHLDKGLTRTFASDNISTCVKFSKPK